MSSDVQIFGLDVGLHGIALSDGDRYARYFPATDITKYNMPISYTELIPVLPWGSILWVESMVADSRTERAQMHAILKLQLIAGAFAVSHGARLVPAGVWSTVPKDVRARRLQLLDPEACAVIAAAMPKGYAREIPRGRTLDVVDAHLIARWGRKHGADWLRQQRGPAPGGVWGA